MLEVGTGLGYQAAVMAEMGAEVFSVEVVEEFAEAAEARFAALGYDVEVRVGDGSRGWAEHAPFDRILVTAAADECASALARAAQARRADGASRSAATRCSSSASSRSEPNRRQSNIREIMPVRFTQLEVAV